MPARPHEEPEEDLLPLPITHENPGGERAKEETVGLGDADLDDDVALDDVAARAGDDELVDLGEHELRHFDDHGARDDGATALDVPELDAHFEDARPDPAADAPAGSSFDERADDDDAFEDAPREEDRGIEGLAGEDAEIDEAALPAMDADLGGELELTDLLSELGFGDARELVSEVAHDVGPATALAVGPQGFCAGGATAVFLEGPAGVEVRLWPRPVLAIEPSQHGFLVRDTGGLVEVAAGRPTSIPLLERAVDQAVVVGDRVVARVGAEVFVVHASGALEAVADAARTIAAWSSTLFVFTTRGTLISRRGGDGAPSEAPLDHHAVEALAAGATVLACDARQCLLGADELLVRVRAGHPTERIALPAGTRVTAACAAGQGLDLLVALTDGERATLASPHAASGELLLLSEPSATLGAEVRALGWDAARQEVVVAGLAGVARLRTRSHH